jgi:hypothetical protein
VGQATWGGFGARHARFEHSARVGAVAFHWDRRARVFERDIFRFGTATTNTPRHTLSVGAPALLISVRSASVSVDRC